MSIHPIANSKNRQIQTSAVQTDPCQSPELLVDVIVNQTVHYKNSKKANDISTKILIRNRQGYKSKLDQNTKTKPNQKIPTVRSSPRPSEALAPKNPEAEKFFEKALELRNADEFAQAEVFAKKAIPLNPHVCDYYILLGICFIARNSICDALNYFELGARANPSESRYHFYIAILQNKYLNNSAIAESHYKKAIDLAPDDYENHLYFAELLESQLKFDKAIYHYKEAERLSPEEKTQQIQANLQRVLKKNEEETNLVNFILTLKSTAMN